MARRKRSPVGQRKLFIDDDQLVMVDKSYEQEIAEKKAEEEKQEKEREKYLKILAEKLRDPEFRKVEGFPVGKDEDILALSDPPYYTACPNPFIDEIVGKWQWERHLQHHKPGMRDASGKEITEKNFDPGKCPKCRQEDEEYHREPFAADVSEGKNDPIYNAHSYHTKVPHKAIMRYILHYTEPGDVVFDGFCGTGMTGVAARLCGDRSAIASLGYTLTADGCILDEDKQTISRCGGRIPVLNDLSPAATLIAAGYNVTTDSKGFARLAKKLLDKFNREYGWMYETRDPKTGVTCPIDYTIWSEVFSCPHCAGELEFWDLAYDEASGTLEERPTCPHCSAEVSKRDLLRRTTTYYDKAVKATRTRQVLHPVEIRYQHQGTKKSKKPDKDDLASLEKVERLMESIEYPTELMMFVPEGEEWGDLYRGYHEGISRAHDFHLPRQLVAFSLLWQMAGDLPSEEMKRLWRFTLQSVLVSFTRRNRFREKAYSQVNTNLSGTLYIGSIVSEPSPTYVLTGKIKRFGNAIPRGGAPVAITTQSLASVLIPDSSVDYVFIDPPFGDNLPYAELNFLWEAWLRVFTNSGQDAVVSGKQRKDLAVYTSMMTDCLKQVYRILKPGRWVTVEFHNSKNAVWTAIQEALGRAGFIIADVSVLDKGMKTKKQMHAKAVDKDLVISAYKPNGGLEKRFQLQAGTEEGVWDFIRTHLRQLPVFIVKGGLGQMIAERQQVLLFDRMVAFHVQRGITIPLSAAEFYLGLARRFVQRDGMYLLPEQAAEYDRRRMQVESVEQMELYVTDERTAVQWLRRQLTQRHQTYSEIQPKFLRELRQAAHEELPELLEMLNQNFLEDDVHRWYVPDPNKEADLEKLREKALLKEFDEYVARRGKLKVFRTEAVRAGFKSRWAQRDYATIVSISRRLPESVLQEDPNLLMYYDNALTRAEG